MDVVSGVCSVWPMVLSLAAIVLAGIGLLCSLVSLSLWYGLRSSTHRVQFVPVDPEKATHPLVKRKLEKEFDTPSAAVKDQQGSKIPTAERLFGLVREDYDDHLV